MISMSEFSSRVNASEGPALSQPFISADDAAIHAHWLVGTRRDVGYAGCIFKRDDGRFVVSEPVKYVEGSFDNRLLYPQDAQGKAVFPAQHTLCGLFYSHVALSMLDAQKIAEMGWTADEAAASLLMFSVPELRYLLEQSQPAYLSGAEHCLFRLSSIPGETGGLTTKLGSEQHPGPLAKRYATGAAKPAELLREVQEACESSVLLSNGLDPQWRRNVRPASFGAVFASADEAAKDLYRRDPLFHDEDRICFGFILKQRGKEEYIASELVPGLRHQWQISFSRVIRRPFVFLLAPPGTSGQRNFKKLAGAQLYRPRGPICRGLQLQQASAGRNGRSAHHLHLDHGWRPPQVSTAPEYQTVRQRHAGDRVCRNREQSRFRKDHPDRFCQDSRHLW
jgi:hypothetical protein